jgi:hypothetical protein
LLYLWKSEKKEQYLLLHNLLKFIIVAMYSVSYLSIHPYYGMEKNAYDGLEQPFI